MKLSCVLFRCEQAQTIVKWQSSYLHIENHWEGPTWQQHKHQYIKTERIFWTDYYIARQGRPFTDMPSCVELQVLNGVSMKRVLQSNMTCAKITLHIATEMRSKLCKKKMVESEVKISVLIDESTTVSRKSVWTVHIRGIVNNSNEPVIFFFFYLNLRKSIQQPYHQHY